VNPDVTLIQDLSAAFARRDLPALLDIFHPDIEWVEPAGAGPEIVGLGHHRGVKTSCGGPFEVPFAHVWTMRDGLAVRFRSYVDTALLRTVFPPDA
jgi:ketosteroid isomerase-like protein